MYNPPLRFQREFLAFVFALPWMVETPQPPSPGYHPPRTGRRRTRPDWWPRPSPGHSAGREGRGSVRACVRACMCQGWVKGLYARTNKRPHTRTRSGSPTQRPPQLPIPPIHTCARYRGVSGCGCTRISCTATPCVTECVTACVCVCVCVWGAHVSLLYVVLLHHERREQHGRRTKQRHGGGVVNTSPN